VARELQERTPRTRRREAGIVLTPAPKEAALLSDAPRAGRTLASRPSVDRATLLIADVLLAVAVLGWVGLLRLAPCAKQRYAGHDGVGRPDGSFVSARRQGAFNDAWPVL
jgi:hypothetical protein